MTSSERAEYRKAPALTPKADGSSPCRKPPQCTANGSIRIFTANELAAYRNGAVFTPAADGSTHCVRPPDFTAVPCVVAGLDVYENTTANSAAEPGVANGDRTLAAAVGRTAWDLDIASSHPLTASPPRDTTAGTGDPSGCADGTETRADHGTRTATSDVSLPAGSRHRKNANAADAATSAAVVLPKSSAAVNSQPPPGHTASEFAAIRENLAHRYASKIAEHTCAVKKKEAEAVLAKRR